MHALTRHYLRYFLEPGRMQKQRIDWSQMDSRETKSYASESVIEWKSQP